MEQEIINLREDVRYLTGVVSGTEEKIDTVINLLRDIRALLLCTDSRPGQNFAQKMVSIRDATASVPDTNW